MIEMIDQTLIAAAVKVAEPFVAGFEGCRLLAYQDIGGLPTIGYGNTSYVVPMNIDRGYSITNILVGPNTPFMRVQLGDGITQEQADELFAATLEFTAEQVSSVLLLKPTANEFAALISFTYNLGIGSFKSSSLLYQYNLNGPGDTDVANRFLGWNKAHVNGVLVEVPGLTKRRAAEARLYLTPP